MLHANTSVVILACIVGLSWASSATAAGGLAWEASITAEGGAPQNIRVLSAAQSLKIQREGGTEYLVRLDRGEAYVIDHKKRTYQRVKLAELENAVKSARAQMQAALGHMRKELEALPPAQRQLLERMVSEHEAAGTPVVRKTGQTKTIAGYKCTEYVAEVEGKTLMTACTTEQIPAFQAMRQDWLAAQQHLGKLNPFGGGDLRHAYGNLPGFPLETKVGGVHALVRKVEPLPPPASEFEVPTGFELQPGPPLPQ